MFASLGAQGYNVPLFALGLWSLYSDKSDPSGVYLLFLLLSILVDLVWLLIYSEDILEDEAGRDIDTKKFALGLAICNVVIKPATAFLAYKAFAAKAVPIAYSGTTKTTTPVANYTDQYDQPQ